MAFRSRASRFWVSALIESLTSMSCFITLGSRLNLFRAEPRCHRRGWPGSGMTGPLLRQLRNPGVRGRELRRLSGHHRVPSRCPEPGSRSGRSLAACPAISSFSFADVLFAPTTSVSIAGSRDSNPHPVDHLTSDRRMDGQCGVMNQGGGVISVPQA